MSSLVLILACSLISLPVWTHYFNIATSPHRPTSPADQTNVWTDEWLRVFLLSMLFSLIHWRLLCHQYLPGLLSLLAGPVQATHVANSTVALWERLEDTEHWVGHHDYQWHHPGGRNDAVGVGSGLPGSGLQRVTNSAVSLDGNGHKAEGGNADRDPCRKEKKSNERTFRDLQPRL